MSTTPNKTVGVTLGSLSWQQVNSKQVVYESGIDVSTVWGIAVNYQLGRGTSTAFTASPNLVVQASAAASGNGKWTDIYSYPMSLGASVANTAVNTGISAGGTQVVVNSASNIAAGDKLFLGHTTTPSNYEIVRVKDVVSTTVHFWFPCEKAHDTGAIVTDQAEDNFAVLGVENYKRIQIVIDNSGGGQRLFGEVIVNRLDSIG